GESGALPGLTVRDEKTLEIRLVAPSATFLTRLASVPTSIVDVADAANDPVSWWQSPNATGPFVIESIDPELLVLRPNPHYGDATKRLQRIEFLLGLSAINPLNLYQDDAIDVVANASGEGSKLIDDPASQVEAVVTRVPLFATSYIAFGNTTEPLDDVHIRRALQLLVSQDLVAYSMFAGTVEAATGMIPTGMLGREWSSSLPTQDFDAARRELSLSRFGVAEAVPTISIFAADIEPVAMLRDLAALELGITIEAIEVRWEDFLAGLVERRFPAYALYWGADYPDPEAMLGMLFKSDGTDNYVGYVNADFDAILDQARRKAVPELRASLYEEAQNLLIADAGIIPLYFDRGVTVSRPGVEGLAVTPLGILGLELVTMNP
ncbi:MAG: ABC transporter substrate-binding protein, partial [Thermomicrobiales bacterium]